MPMIDVDGHKISVIDTKTDGPPVVLLHSSGLAGLQWRALMQDLMADHRVIAPDFIGYGASAAWPEDRDFDYRMDVAVARAAVELAGAPAHVIGHSYGGLIGMLAVADGSIPIASIACYEPVVFGVLKSTGNADVMGPFADPAEAAAFFDLDEEGLEGWLRRFVDWWNGAGAYDALPAHQKAIFMKAAHKTRHEVQTLSTDETPHTAFTGFEGPALLLTGGASPKPAQRVAEILADTLPGGRLHRFEHLGHMAPVSAAKDVNAVLRDHLARAIA